MRSVLQPPAAAFYNTWFARRLILNSEDYGGESSASKVECKVKFGHDLVFITGLRFPMCHRRRSSEPLSSARSYNSSRRMSEPESGQRSAGSSRRASTSSYGAYSEDFTTADEASQAGDDSRRTSLTEGNDSDVAQSKARSTVSGATKR